MTIKFNILTHLHLVRPKQAWQCWKYLTYKQFSEKHLIEKWWLDAIHQLSFRYFVNFRFIAKLFSKIWEYRTMLSREKRSVNGLKNNWMKKWAFADKVFFNTLYIEVNTYSIFIILYKQVILLCDCVKDIWSLFMMSHSSSISWELTMYK